MTHLNHLVEETTYPSAEKAKFKGIYEKYRNAKYPLYLKYFIEILVPAAELSLNFQRETIDVESQKVVSFHWSCQGFLQ